jgi:hypothetical protein
MASIGTRLASILARHNLSRPDGRPLYGYHVTGDELALLRQDVADRARGGAPYSTVDAAGIALYVAEAFCRSHRSGPWKWETATASVGLGDDAVKALYTPLERAIETYWGRKLIRDARGARQFHLTLACEGGLPHNLLAAEHGALGVMFRRVLTERERLPDTIDTITLVHDEIARLPASLSTGEVIRLTAALVDAVRALRLACPEASTADDPLRVLDEKQPGWAGRMPLRLEQDAARRLLAGLVTQAHASDREAVCELEAVLRSADGGGWRLRRHIRVPSRVAAHALQETFGAPELMPNRMELLVRSQDGTSAVAAHLALSGDGRFYRVEPRRGEPLPLGSRIRAELAACGRSIGQPVEPPGATCMTGEPWVFLDHEGDASWIGDGSISSRAESLLAVVPADFVAVVDDGGACEAVGEVDGLSVYRLRGAVTLHPPGEAAGYRVVASAGGARSVCLLTDKGFFALGGYGDEVLRGDPEIVAGEESARRRIRVEEIEYARPGTPGRWARLDDSAVGEIWLRVVRDGVLWLRRKVVRVPGGFGLRLKPAPEAGTGDVVLEGLGTDDIAIEPVADVQVEVSPTPTGVRVRLRAAGRNPQWVRLRLRLAGAPPVWVRVPFPARQVGFVEPGGRPLEPGATVAIDRLPGVRAQVVDLEGARWSLEGRCVASDITWTTLRELRAERSGWSTLPLDEVEHALRLMMAGGQLDTKVDLHLASVGGRARRIELSVAPYARVLQPLERAADGTPALIDVDPAASIDDVRLEIRPLAEPGAPPVVAHPSPTGRGWSWPESAGPGRWLCTAWEVRAAGSLAAARPLLVRIGDGDTQTPEVGLLSAIHAADERGSALDAAISILAGDAANADWGLLDDHLDTLGMLPATTFDVVAALARSPDAVALAALRRAWLEPHRLGVFADQIETLPFAWWLVPPAAWFRAAHRLKACLDQICARVSAFDTGAWLRKTIDALAARTGVLATWATWVAGALGLSGEWSRYTEIAGHMMASDWDRAVQLGADARWPEVDLDGLGAAIGLEIAAIHALRPDPRAPWRASVAGAPIIAALAAAHGRRVPPRQLIELRRLRAFDADWFDQAWGMTLVRLWAAPASRPLFTEDAR